MGAAPLAVLAAEVAEWEATVPGQVPGGYAFAPIAEKRCLTSRELPASI